MLQPKDTDWLNGLKKIRHIYAIYKIHTQMQGHIQTESEGMRKGIQCKWKSKESCSSNIHIKKETLKYRWLEDTKDAT